MPPPSLPRRSVLATRRAELRLFHPPGLHRCRRRLCVKVLKATDKRQIYGRTGTSLADAGTSGKRPADRGFSPPPLMMRVERAGVAVDCCCGGDATERRREVRRERRRMGAGNTGGWKQLFVSPSHCWTRPPDGQSLALRPRSKVICV